MPYIDLPIELLPFIIQHIPKPHHLAQVCLVNKDFYQATVPLLYERPVIYAWYKEAKKRATQLFWTLANCPDLARHVHRLELRDFPKAVAVTSSVQLTQLCITGLANCTNLTSCTWTRDGSLKDEILLALSHCPSLHSLELNGRHVHNYDPEILEKFEKLRKISVIMPSTEVVGALPGCFERNFGTLEELTIICKFTPVVTDTWLQTMAPTLSRLKKLHLAGCPKVTHRGIIDLLRANSAGLTDLALENVSRSFDMMLFAATSSQSLTHLSSITLASPILFITHTSWLNAVLQLLSSVHSLKNFHLYISGEQPPSFSLSLEFIRRLVERHGGTLTRFAVLKVPVSLEGLNLLIRRAERIREVFVSIWRQNLNALSRIIAQSKALRTLHLMYSPKSAGAGVLFRPETSWYHLQTRAEAQLSSSEAYPSNLLVEENETRTEAETEAGPFAHSQPETDLEELVSQFGPGVTQFGVQTRVWQVERVFTEESESETEAGQGGDMDGQTAVRKRKVRLVPYEFPDVPDVFLVVRT